MHRRKREKRSRTTRLTERARHTCHVGEPNVACATCRALASDGPVCKSSQYHAAAESRGHFPEPRGSVFPCAVHFRHHPGCLGKLHTSRKHEALNDKFKRPSMKSVLGRVVRGQSKTTKRTRVVDKAVLGNVHNTTRFFGTSRTHNGTGAVTGVP